MADRLVLLGTGTCQLEPGRAASAVLVEVGGVRLVYDLGPGVARRLVELGLRQDDVEHIVLSHFHPDHLADLIPYLHAACWSRIDPRARDLHIYGPPGLEIQLMRLLSLFEPENILKSGGFRVHLHEEPGDTLTVAGQTFAWLHLPPAGNRGLRFTGGSGTWALTGDSHFHRREIDFLTAVDLAVIDSGHLSDEEIVELAVASGAERLVCSHLYRPLDAAELNERARRRGYGGRILVGRDRMELRLPDPRREPEQNSEHAARETKP